MRKLFTVFSVVLLAIGLLSSPAALGLAFPGSQASLLPNYTYPVQTFTAASATGTTLFIGGVRSGLITAFGTALTTATWKIQGSNDGGAHFFDLPTAAYPTTAIPITTTAVSQTTTATTLYMVNLAGFTNVRFVTTSGTFTGTNLKLALSASANGGYL
jgi:hypothetical protein